MSLSRSSIRLALSVVLALPLAGAVLSSPAGAAEICATTSNGTTCVDPTGECLISNSPKLGHATCVPNPIG